MAEEQQGSLTVDGKEYDPAKVSENAKGIIRNIQFADQELARLRLQTAAMQTARTAYVGALKSDLESSGAAKEQAVETAE